MDPTVLANLLSLGAAIIPVVGIVVTVLKSSDGSRKLPLDTSLKLTKISRTPISDDDLKQQKNFLVHLEVYQVCLR